MYRIVHGATHRLPDVEAFIETLGALDQHPAAEVRGLFDAEADVVVARAPGRLDVMGGIADYSGSLVLQLPIREATLVALQRDSSRTLRIVSLRADGTTSFEMPVGDFEQMEYRAARAYFQRDPDKHWAAYVAGAFLVLMREIGIAFNEGARILVASQVPEGKGVSSSAALEVAAMQAIAAAFAVDIGPRKLALLCQKVENLVVGAPCGVMDQMTAACGEANRLLALLCQPAELEGMVSIPEELAVWGLDSGVRHSVSGADYTSVRVGAFMGYRITAEMAGLPVTIGDRVHIADHRWRGYLANLTPSEFEQFYSARLPERMTGAEFLERYGGTTDTVTRVRPDRNYAVRTPTAHPIYEHFRVRSFAELLGAPPNERRWQLLGELMYQSHASYSACGLGSEGTDLLVKLVRAAGPAQGLYGAKITGGGSGGTVAVLGRRGADSAIQAVADEYARETGYQPYIFTGSSPGASVFELKLMSHSSL
jgi:L-arabinokinase